MKVSGSHIEKVRAWTNMGYEASESATIQATVEKLAKEGKQVINIIHGDKTMIGGDYAKNITFLWEGDDEDIQQKCAELAEITAQNTMITVQINRLEEEIDSLKEKIQLAEESLKRKANKQSMDDYLKEESRGNFKVAFYALIFALSFFGLGFAFESFIFYALGVVIALFSLFGFYMGLSKKQKKEIKDKMEQGESYVTNLGDLRVKMKTKQKEVETLKSQLK